MLWEKTKQRKPRIRSNWVGGLVTTLFRVVSEIRASLERYHLSKDLRKVRKVIVKLSVGRMFQAEKREEQYDYGGWTRKRKTTVGEQVREVR